MPINIPDNLPAKEILTGENIFVMTKERAEHQDVRPLRIAIMNLMPTKIVTETQILRLLGNTPIQSDVVLLHPKTYQSRNTSAEHLQTFYKNFDDVRHEKFDGLIITGAPVELLAFEEVDYWDELVELMEWSRHNVFSTLHICWGAQAGLYHHYGIPKHLLARKMFGVFPHTLNRKGTKLLQGFDDEFFVPHSRHTEVRREDIRLSWNLEILSESDESGVFLVQSRDGRQIFATGHAEYDSHTLKAEYDRDVGKGLAIAVPANYYPNDDPAREPIVRWRSHANLLFGNWINYYVYQETPYDLNQLEDAK